MVKYDNILKAIEVYLEKCHREGTLESSGILPGINHYFFNQNHEKKENDLPTTRLENIAKLLCEKFGLEISLNRVGDMKINGNKHNPKFYLWDDENKTEIDLSAILSHDGWIDFSNSNHGIYNINDVLTYYDNMPSLMKYDVKNIKFSEFGGSSYCDQYGNVTISSMVYGQGANDPKITDENGIAKAYNMQRVMYHECGHAVEFSVLRNHNFRISNTKDYNYAMNMNNSFFASNYSEDYFFKTNSFYGEYNNANVEDFAETMAMVAFDDIKDKHNSISIPSSFSGNVGGLENYSSFKKNHQGTYDFCKAILNNEINLSTLKLNY